MTGKEIVRRSLYFQTPPRLPRDFPEPYGSDFVFTGPEPNPDARAARGTDAWGCVWNSLGGMQLGEVVDHPIKTWDDFKALKIPDIENDAVWESAKKAREKNKDKYMIGNVTSLYERLHFLRGLENTWCDIREEPEKLSGLVGLLADLGVRSVRRLAACGADGIIMWDDWGLQDRLMISPDDWRALWKPAYRRVFDAAAAEGMDAWLHSCGYIADILDDLIEIGLKAVHMDQQENMGLARLGAFRGRLTFFSPVDIQKTMARGSEDEIRAYCREMAARLGAREGGFIPRWYTDPVGAGHTRRNINVMCEEFLKISEEMYGKEEGAPCG
ncbi:MAG: hypothetical protein FWC55_01020 [Firmicutes bacterium]|nr:hypothetical protein [Bacillota bacterium]